MRDLSKPLAPTYGDPKKKKERQKERASDKKVRQEKRAFDKRGRQIKREVKKEIRQENKKAAPKKTLTVTGSKSNVKRGREHPNLSGHRYGQTSTGVSTFTKKRRDGTVKKTITSKSTLKERRGKSDARTNKTTKTKYSKDGSVRKSKTLKRGSRKTTKSAMKAARDMRAYGKGAKVTFVQKTKKKL